MEMSKIQLENVSDYYIDKTLCGRNRSHIDESQFRRYNKKLDSLLQGTANDFKHLDFERS